MYEEKLKWENVQYTLAEQHAKTILAVFRIAVPRSLTKEAYAVKRGK